MKECMRFLVGSVDLDPDMIEPPHVIRPNRVIGLLYLSGLPLQPDLSDHLNQAILSDYHPYYVIGLSCTTCKACYQTIFYRAKDYSFPRLQSVGGIIQYRYENERTTDEREKGDEDTYRTNAGDCYRWLCCGSCYRPVLNC